MGALRLFLGACRKGFATYAIVAIAIVMGTVWFIGNSQSASANTTGAARITAINPDEGPIEGGNTVTITGEEFINSFTKIAPSYYNTTCALNGLKEVYCWGYNNFGEVGKGTSGGNVDVPTKVVGLPSNIIDVEMGGSHACALTADAKVYCWGRGPNGELGDGWNDYYTNHNVGAPVLATAFSGIDVVQVKPGSGFTCVLDSLGDVYCIGYNASGQLGNGTTTNWDVANPTPVKANITNVTSLTVGQNHACAIVASGSVWCWGANGSGQLGLGTVGVDVSTPTQVTGLNNIENIYPGNDHTCAIDTNGDMFCWGANWSGQLGNGTSGSASTTIYQVQSGGIKFASASLNYNGTCAVTVDGAAMCWGNDYPDGRLGIAPGGNGNSIYYHVPTAVMNPMNSGVVQIGTLYTATCALIDDGSIWCWGSDYVGQLGRGYGTWSWSGNGNPYGIPEPILYDYEVFLTKVTLDGLECTDLEVISSTQATCTAPAHAAGKVDVTGYFSTGGSSTLTSAYEYVSPAGPGDDDPVVPGVPNTGATTTVNILSSLMTMAGIVLLVILTITMQIKRESEEK